MMKILWFTNVPLPAVKEKAGIKNGGSGHWMTRLAEELNKFDGIQLAVVTSCAGVEDLSFTQDKIVYYLLGQPKRFSILRYRPVDIQKAAICLQEFKPDVVHIHGTERYYGMLKMLGHIQVPEIISLQGILGPYSTYTNWFGALSPIQILSSTRVYELLLGSSLIWRYRNIRKAAIREREMCKYTDAFLGRTDWDSSWAHVLNPKAKYFHVGEILRKEFLEAQWDISKVKRHSLLFTNAGHPRRGTDVLLEAVKILKRDIPDIELRLAGHISPRSGYGRFLHKLIKKSGLADCVKLLGYLNASEMTKELAATHVFAIASFIENSPNSLAEAMMVGVPCVASYVGGIPSMIENRQTGLLFPAGDANWLAESIRSVFADDLLASRLGAAARQVARQRHRPDLVVSQLIEAYRQVLLTDNMARGR